MPPARFEPAIPASERPQTHALDCAATEIGVGNTDILNTSQAVRLTYHRAWEQRFLLPSQILTNAANLNRIVLTQAP